RIVSRRGRAGFYEGEVADDMVSRLRALGGLHALEDFSATKGDYVRPVGTSYRGYDIHQMPPNNQGLTALIMLNVLSGFSLGSLEPNGAERFHLEIEAGRLAYQDRDNFIGDQSQVHVPVEQLLSRSHA
ncbi:MAG: gamma-glutamyltransferase, partial [Mesorhizobium sp.]